MGTVMTVNGPVSSDQLGFTLPHEHIFLDLSRDFWGRNAMLNDTDLAYDELMLYKNAGGVSIVDQTTANLTGSDNTILDVPHPIAIRDISKRTGLNIVLGAGWYREMYYDKRLDRMKVNEIADELVDDVKVGLNGTDVKAGILGEIGSHFTYISSAEERVLRAAARAQKETGLTIATHTYGHTVGLDQLDLLEEEGVDLRRVVIGHCHQYPKLEYHAEIARRGAWVQFDRMGRQFKFEHDTWIRMVMDVINAGLIRQVLLSQDVCFRPEYVSYGGKGYIYVIGELREELAALGVTGEQYDQMTIDNPRRMLTGED